MIDLSGSDGREEALRLLTFGFFRSVSFETGLVASCERLLGLFMESGPLIRNRGAKPETSAVRHFIEPRQALVGGVRVNLTAWVFFRAEALGDL